MDEGHLRRAVEGRLHGPVVGVVWDEARRRGHVQSALELDDERAAADTILADLRDLAGELQLRQRRLRRHRNHDGLDLDDPRELERERARLVAHLRSHPEGWDTDSEHFRTTVLQGRARCRDELLQLPWEVRHQAETLARRVAHEGGWSPDDALHLVLTGEVPDVSLVQSATRVVDGWSVVTITASVWARPDDVVRAFERARREQRTRGPRRPLSRKILDLVRFVATHPPRHSARHLVNEWNLEHPDDMYLDDRAFAGQLRRALDRFLLAAMADDPATPPPVPLPWLEVLSPTDA